MASVARRFHHWNRGKGVAWIVRKNKYEESSHMRLQAICLFLSIAVA